MAQSHVLEGVADRAREDAQGGLFAPSEIGEVDGRGSAVSGEKRAGRPSGSRNKAGRELREFYLGRFHDPLAGAISWSLTGDILHDVIRAASLARIIGCRTFEALEFMRRSGEGAMPYLHARAVEMKLDHRKVEVRIGLGQVPKVGSDALGGLASLRAEFDQALDAADPATRAAIQSVADDLIEQESAGNSNG